MQQRSKNQVRPCPLPAQDPESGKGVEYIDDSQSCSAAKVMQTLVLTAVPPPSPQTSPALSIVTNLVLQS